MGMFFDFVNAIINQNPELLAYIKYTAYHSSVILFRKLSQSILKTNARADKRINQAAKVTPSIRIPEQVSGSF
jgi:hypothetical protein